MPLAVQDLGPARRTFVDGPANSSLGHLLHFEEGYHVIIPDQPSVVGRANSPSSQPVTHCLSV